MWSKAIWRKVHLIHNICKGSICQWYSNSQSRMPYIAKCPQSIKLATTRNSPNLRIYYIVNISLDIKWQTLHNNNMHYDIIECPIEMATSDRLPHSSSKDGTATDSCFALIDVHQCGVLMVDVGWLAASVSTTSLTLVVSTETYKEGYSRRDWSIIERAIACSYSSHCRGNTLNGNSWVYYVNLSTTPVLFSSW